MSDSARVGSMVERESDPVLSEDRQTEEIRRPCIRSLYCKILICISAIAAFGLFLNFLLQCLGTKTPKDRTYSSVAAGISIALSIVLAGIVICYRRREIDGCWLFTDFLRRHLAFRNNPYRTVNLENAGGQNESGLENAAENKTARETGTENNESDSSKLLSNPSNAERLPESLNTTACKVSAVASSVSLIASAVVAGDAVKNVLESTKAKDVPSTAGSKPVKSSGALAPKKSPIVINFVEYDSNDEYEYI